MEKLNKGNLANFIGFYHAFHDSVITNINYDVNKDKIELLVNVCWTGEATLKEDGYYETNSKKMKMIFSNIIEYKCSEICSWDFIYEIYLEYVMLDGKEYICFASDEKDPFIYIVCDSIEYEEI